MKPIRSLCIPAALLGLAACGDDPKPAPPDPKTCLERLPASQPPPPVRVSVDKVTLARPYVPDLESDQILEVTATGPSAFSAALIGPIITREDQAPIQQLTPVEAGLWKITAPQTAGSYEVQLTAPDQQIKLDVEVILPPLAMCLSTDQLEPNGVFWVNWTGLSAPGHRLEFIDPVLNKVVLTASAASAPREMSGTLMKVPNQPGFYQVTYTLEDGTPISTQELLAWRRDENELLRARDVVAANESMTVQWIAPPRRNHKFRILDAQTRQEVIVAEPQESKFGPSRATLTAPPAGNYIMVYSNPEIGPAAAEQPLTVIEDAPPS